MDFKNPDNIRKLLELREQLRTSGVESNLSDYAQKISGDIQADKLARTDAYKVAHGELLDKILAKKRRLSSVAGDGFSLVGKPQGAGKLGDAFRLVGDAPVPALRSAGEMAVSSGPLDDFILKGKSFIGDSLPMVRDAAGDVISTTARHLDDVAPKILPMVAKGAGFAGKLAIPAAGIAADLAAMEPVGEGSDQNPDSFQAKNYDKILSAYNAAQSFNPSEELGQIPQYNQLAATSGKLPAELIQKNPIEGLNLAAVNKQFENSLQSKGIAPAPQPSRTPAAAPAASLPAEIPAQSSPVEAEKKPTDPKELLMQQLLDSMNGSSGYMDARRSEDNVGLFTRLGEAAQQVGAGIAGLGGAGPIAADTAFLQKLRSEYKPTTDVKEMEAEKTKRLTNLLTLHSKLNPEKKKTISNVWVSQKGEPLFNDGNSFYTADGNVYNESPRNLTKESADESRGLRKNQNEIMNEFRKQSESDRQSFKQDKEVEKLSTRIEKGQVNELVDTMTRIEGNLSKQGHSLTEVGFNKNKNIKGAGYGVSKLPDLLVSDAGVDLRQDIQALANIILKRRSGSAVTDPEFARFLKESSQGIFSSDANTHTWLKKMKNTVRGEVNNVESGYKPQTRESYKSNMGEELPSERFSKVFGQKDAGKNPATKDTPKAPAALGSMKTYNGLNYVKTEKGWGLVK